MRCIECYSVVVVVVVYRLLLVGYGETVYDTGIVLEMRYCYLRMSWVLSRYNI